MGLYAMTIAADLFSWVGPGARKSDPDTSQSMASVDRSKDREAVLAVHREHPKGLTDFELAEIMGRQQTSVGKRRCELRDQGLIENSGLKRPSPSGSNAIVWRLRP